jgi:hypothetical protein
MDVEKIAVIATAAVKSCRQDDGVTKKDDRQNRDPDELSGRGISHQSSAGLFLIAAQCRNLISQSLGALNIAPGEGHSQSKF